jgi:hypothetical protein
MWLQKQRTLAASMQTLQASSAGREAGPDVERAMLQAFRQVAPARAAVPVAGEFAAGGTSAANAEARNRTQPLRPVVASRSTPVALRLSHFFEFGAYAAVAAAIIVSVFVGIRLLQDHRTASPAQSQSVPASVAPAAQKPEVAEQNNVVERGSTPTVRKASTLSRRKIETGKSGAAQTGVAEPHVMAEESLPVSNDDYIALMFCDPLSCSSDSQVVRMELPGSANADSQPQIADVVVGYDGVVRAVRIVN